MDRRSALAVLFCCTVSVPVPTWAQGNGQGNGNNKGGNSNNGNGTNGNNGNGNGNNGNVNANGNPATVTDESVPASQPAELSDSDAVAAVEAGIAVSLETILPDLRSRTGGELIEAKLQRTEGFLLYAVTALTPEGKVVTEYYYARSGLHVDR